MLHETLTTDPEAWGLTQVQYASREKARLRARERMRRVRARVAAENALAAMLQSHREVETFMTASGILAYRKEIPNRISLTSQPVYESTATKIISLPWVSILGERHHRYGEGV